MTRKKISKSDANERRVKVVLSVVNLNEEITMKTLHIRICEGRFSNTMYFSSCQVLSSFVSRHMKKYFEIVKKSTKGTLWKRIK